MHTEYQWFNVGAGVKLALLPCDSALEPATPEHCRILAGLSYVAGQLEAIGQARLAVALSESHAWTESELCDDSANRLRAVWLACWDAKLDTLPPLPTAPHTPLNALDVWRNDH